MAHLLKHNVDVTALYARFYYKHAPDRNTRTRDYAVSVQLGNRDDLSYGELFREGAEYILIKGARPRQKPWRIPEDLLQNATSNLSAHAHLYQDRDAQLVRPYSVDTSSSSGSNSTTWTPGDPLKLSVAIRVAPSNSSRVTKDAEKGLVTFQPSYWSCLGIHSNYNAREQWKDAQGSVSISFLPGKQDCVLKMCHSKRALRADVFLRLEITQQVRAAE
jgi:hypothetical protein